MTTGHRPALIRFARLLAIRYEAPVYLASDGPQGLAVRVVLPDRAFRLRYRRLTDWSESERWCDDCSRMDTLGYQTTGREVGVQVIPLGHAARQRTVGELLIAPEQL